MLVMSPKDACYLFKFDSRDQVLLAQQNLCPGQQLLRAMAISEFRQWVETIFAPYAPYEYRACHFATYCGMHNHNIL